MSRFARTLAAVAAFALLTAGCSAGATEETPTDITLDWAYYNPVSLVLKEKGWVEEELAEKGIAVTWVQSAGSNKALEFLAAESIDFGSTAGAAALLGRIGGSPIRSIYTYSKPEWTALVTSADSDIQDVGDLAGRTVAVTRGTDPYIFLLRALADNGLSEADITTVLLQHADGRNALVTGQVDAWAGLDPMMAQSELEEGTRLFHRAPELNSFGVLNTTEAFAEAHPEIVAAVLAVYERGRLWALENPEELSAILAVAAGLSQEVADAQLARTDLTVSGLGEAQRQTILSAGLALQEAGVIEADVEVEATLDELFDTSFAESLAG